MIAQLLFWGENKEVMRLAQQTTKTKFYIFLTIMIPTLAVPFGIYQLFMGYVSWLDIFQCVLFYVLSMIAISVGFHRLFTHRTFKAGRLVKWVLAIGGSMTWQGNLLNWAAEHRIHHALSDQQGDFHSPFIRQDGTKNKTLWQQFVHSHFMWFFRRENKDKYKVVRDLMRDKALMYIDRNYLLWSLLSLVVPGVIGLLVHLQWRGFWQGVLWGGLIRIFLVHHTTWCINSVTHLFGKRKYKTSDNSNNLTWYAILAFGEGYHNNHHAFPRSAHFGFDKGQVFDLGWQIIKVLDKMKLISEVMHAPTLEQRQKKLLSAADSAGANVDVDVVATKQADSERSDNDV